MEKEIVLIGSKPWGIYEKFIKTKLSQAKELTIKSRGRNIVNAISLMTYFEREKIVTIKNVRVSSSTFEGNGFVPEIEIKVIKIGNN